MAEHSLSCSVNAPGFIRYSGEQAEENTEPLTDERRLTHNPKTGENRFATTTYPFYMRHCAQT